jgi:hypothetical protein
MIVSLFPTIIAQRLNALSMVGNVELKGGGGMYADRQGSIGTLGTTGVRGQGTGSRDWGLEIRD